MLLQNHKYKKLVILKIFHQYYMNMIYNNNKNESIILKIISSFLTYRYVLNDGDSFLRVFSFFLLEHYIFNESDITIFLLNVFISLFIKILKLFII